MARTVRREESNRQQTHTRVCVCVCHKKKKQTHREAPARALEGRSHPRRGRVRGRCRRRTVPWRVARRPDACTGASRRFLSGTSASLLLRVSYIRQPRVIQSAPSPPFPKATLVNCRVFACCRRREKEKRKTKRKKMKNFNRQPHIPCVTAGRRAGGRAWKMRQTTRTPLFHPPHLQRLAPAPR